MTISYSLGKHLDGTTQITYSTFPSGIEIDVKVPEQPFQDSCEIWFYPRNPMDLMALVFAVDALKRRNKFTFFSLNVSYLPYARQDHTSTKEDSLSLKVVADMINSCGFDEVKIFDPHSDVSLALINKSFAVRPIGLLTVATSNNQDAIIVSPDAGAYKRIHSLCSKIGWDGEISSCSKARTPDGRIASIQCDREDYQGKDVIIVDDICDGGGTFVLLAKELKKRNAGKINLCVSHGIFSRGLEALEGIDHIYTTESMCDLASSDKLTIAEI